MKFKRVTKRNKCAICGQPDWCGVSEDGKFAVCMRTESDKIAKNGGWIHILIEDDGQPKKPVRIVPKAPEPPAPEKRSAEDLDAVYSLFLRQLVLATGHSCSLRERGLDWTDIHLHGYKSMATAGYHSSIAERISHAVDLRNVPGFYRAGGRHWRFVDYHGATGFLIPIRNGQHKIVGLQLRRDDAAKPKYMMISSASQPGGASSGTPPHFAYAGVIGAPSSFETVIVTEGALKANIIARYAERPTIGLVGVGCFDETFPEMIRATFPNVRRVLIAFDMDAATNPAVRTQRERLDMTIRKLNLKTSILSWNGLYKGFDDFLVGTKTKIKLAA